MLLRFQKVESTELICKQLQSIYKKVEVTHKLKKHELDKKNVFADTKYFSIM